MMEKTKKCTGCKIEKPLKDFHRNSSTKDGRACRCKDCLNPDVNRRHREKREEAKMWSPI